MSYKKLSMVNIIKYSAYFILLLLISSCDKQDNGLAPYNGETRMTNITVEDSTYNPRVTWIGGYAEVFGVNKGSHAALDGSLVWLIHKSDNGLHYPIKYGELPEGAEDITNQYGGVKSNLIEDQTYTYWVMKEDVWNQISSMQNKVLMPDSTLSSGFVTDSDTIRISTLSGTLRTKNIDKYLNIYDRTNTGIKLGVISVFQTDTSNTPIITWTITQPGVTDTLIAAIGICEGAQYDPAKIVWEVYSDDIVDGKHVYGKSNVIAPPVYPKNPLTGVQVFKEYSVSKELEKGKGYYVWIANKNWDPNANNPRLRTRDYYAFMTFKTN